MPGEDALLDETLAVLDDLVAFPTVALTPNVDLIGYVEDQLGPLCSCLLYTSPSPRD